MQIFNNPKNKFKKVCSKSLRVLAKNQWGLKFVEKILKFTYKNLNGKLTFSPFSIQSFRTFVKFKKYIPLFCKIQEQSQSSALSAKVHYSAKTNEFIKTHEKDQEPTRSWIK